MLSSDITSNNSRWRGVSDAAVQCSAQRLDHSPDRKVQLKYICCGVGDPSPPRRHRLHSVSSGVEGGSSFPCRALNNAHLSGDGHFCVMRCHVGHMSATFRAFDGFQIIEIGAYSFLRNAP